MRILSRMTSYFPHVKLPVPYRLYPKRSIKVYIDSELGLPLNFREPMVQTFFVERIYDYGVIFDIGAHIGTYSILATCSESTEVHAFEPHPHNFKRLQENISQNGLENQVNTVSAAVTNSGGEIELGIGDNDVTHSVVFKNRNSINVDSITLDSYCDERALYPDLIKIDVEGSGKLVIEGALEVLDKQPDWLIEIHSKEEENELRELFESKGYTITQLSKDHLFMSVE